MDKRLGMPLILSDGQMLYCVPKAPIKSFSTGILRREDKHQGVRGTGGTMLIVRGHLFEG